MTGRLAPARQAGFPPGRVRDILADLSPALDAHFLPDLFSHPAFQVDVPDQAGPRGTSVSQGPPG
jgi:hypothetical protein